MSLDSSAESLVELDDSFVYVEHEFRIKIPTVIQPPSPVSSPSPVSPISPRPNRRLESFILDRQRILHRLLTVLTLIPVEVIIQFELAYASETQSFFLSRGGTKITAKAIIHQTFICPLDDAADPNLLRFYNPPDLQFGIDLAEIIRFLNTAMGLVDILVEDMDLYFEV